MRGFAVALICLFIAGGVPETRADGLEGWAACMRPGGKNPIAACTRLIASAEWKDSHHLGGFHHRRAGAYWKQKRIEPALKDYTIALQHRPRDAHLQYERGNVYLHLKQYDKAIADYDTAIQLHPKLVFAYNNRGIAYSRTGHYVLALADFGHALLLAPRARTYHNRAWAYLRSGEPAKGLPDIDKALELSPGHANAWHTRGRLYEALGQRDKAIAGYTWALKLDPKRQSSKDGLSRMKAAR